VLIEVLLFTIYYFVVYEINIKQILQHLDYSTEYAGVAGQRTINQRSSGKEKIDKALGIFAVCLEFFKLVVALFW